MHLVKLTLSGKKTRYFLNVSHKVEFWDKKTIYWIPLSQNLVAKRQEGKIIHFVKSTYYG